MATRRPMNKRNKSGGGKGQPGGRRRNAGKGPRVGKCPRGKGK